MQLILLQKVVNLGNLGDRVNVKAGYGRNYLVPYGKAVPATETNLAEFEQRRAEYEAKAAAALGGAEARRNTLSDAKVSIEANASTEGKLYGSVAQREISEAFTNAGFPLNKSEILMPDGPIRRIGEYQLQIQLHADIGCKVTLEVTAA